MKMIEYPQSNGVTIVTYIYKDINSLDESLSIDLNMVIYCTRNLYEYVKSIRNKYDTDNTKTIFNIVEISDLEIYQQHQTLINENKIDINTVIAFNKTSFIRTLAKTNPFKSGHFLWSDVELLKNLKSIDIQKYLINKIVHIEKYLIVPQNLAWHYRHLIDKEFHNNIVNKKTPNEIDICRTIENNNKDIIGYNNITAVIARYDEDVSWVRGLKCDYIIYNKNQTENSLFENNLPNIGREGHTFLTYILDNYEKLPNYVCFLHGVPFDHCLDILNKINNFNMTDEFLPLSTSYLLADWEWEKTYAFLDELGLSYDNPLKMISSCQCIVSKELILKTSKETYEKLLNKLSYSTNPFPEAYIIENLWPTIFNFNNELIPSCDNCRGYWGDC